MKTSIKIDKLFISSVGTNKWSEVAKSTREATAKYTEADATKNPYKNVLGKVIEESSVDGEKTITFQIADFTPAIVQLFKGGTVTSDGGNTTYKAPVNNQVIEKSIKILSAKGIIYEYPRVSISTSINVADDDLHYLNIMGTVLVPEDETEDMRYTVLSDASKLLNEITSFYVGSVVGTIAGSAIGIELPEGTDFTAITPSVITSLGAVYTPQGSVNFTNPVNFIVKSVSGASKTYVVTVTVPII